MPDNTTPPNHLQSPDSAGTQASDDGYTPADLDRLTGANLFPHLNDLPLEERLQIIKTYQFPEQWFDEEPLLALVVLRQQKPRQWFGIKAYAKARGVNVYELDKAVEDTLAVIHRAEQAATRSEPLDAAPGQAGTGQDPEALDQQQRAPCVVLRDASTVHEEPTQFLWEGRIARKKLNMLDGDPGVGKTMLALQLAANITRGWPMPDDLGRVGSPHVAPENVLLVAMEDGLDDRLVPGLRLSGANLERITFLECVTEHGVPRPFLVSDMALLADHMRARRPALVYIDAIQAVLGGKMDINRANQVTAVLLKLREFAEQYNTAILFARHPAKPGQNAAKLIYRGMGSQAFIGTVRLGLFVEEHPGDKDKVLVIHSKSNAGALRRTQIFSKQDGQFAWCGVTRIDGRMMAGSTNGPDPLALLQAISWLETRLEGGLPWRATDIQTEANEEGYKRDTLYRAKKALLVESREVVAQEETYWTWRLPPLSLLSPSPPPTTPSTPSTPSTLSTRSAASVRPEPSLDTSPSTSSVVEPQKPHEMVQPYVPGTDAADPAVVADMAETEEASSIFPSPTAPEVPLDRGPVPAAAPAGGFEACQLAGEHSWIRRAVDRYCVRCFLTSPLLEEV